MTAEGPGTDPGTDLGTESSPDLLELAERVSACTQCRLAGGRTRAVPGDGPTYARVMFVGEAPGYHEDRQGRPFVGAAGQLLDDLLAGVGLRRSDVFVTNIVKCRPPANRDPLPDEIQTCRAYLEEQISLVDPEVVVALGRFALEFFLPGERISRVHGRPRRLGARTFLPMLHPAAALHQASWRPQLEADFAALGQILAPEPGVAPADRSGSQPTDESGSQPADESGSQPADESGSQPADGSGSQPTLF